MLVLNRPAMTTANLEVASLAELKEFMVTTGQVADDARAQKVVDGVNRALYHRLRERFIKSTGAVYDVLLDGSWNGSTLALPYKPVVSITSIEQGSWDNSGWLVGYTYLATDYVTDADAGLLHNVVNGWPKLQHATRILYQAGFTTVPHDLKLAVLEWMAVELARVRGSRLDMTGQANESGSTTYTYTAVPGTAASVIDRYALKGRMF